MRFVPKFRQPRRFLLLLVSIALVASACSGDDTGGTGDTGDGTQAALADPTSTAATTDPASGDDSTGTSDGTQAMTVRIENGESPSDTQVTIDLNELSDRPVDAVAPNRTVDGDDLSATARGTLLDRLQALEADEGDQVEFARPTDTRLPPRPQAIVDASFPPSTPDTRSPDPEQGPLEVLRFQPTGQVDIAPFVSVTFNKPMVPVGTIDQIEAADIPVTVEPALEGRWLWLGTRTLRFENASDTIDRLPKATEYQVTIPAGVQADDGSTLDEAVEFTFTTPPAAVTSVSPLNSSLATDTLFLVEFNQRVNAGDALGSIELRADQDPVPVRLATPDEIADDLALELKTSRLLDDRWLVMRAADELPTDSDIEISARSVPSAEGPLVGDEVARFSGRTYSRFAFRESRCAWGRDECPPGSPLQIRFSNPIATDDFDVSLITVEPTLPGAQIGIEYDSIVVRGPTVGRTDYTVSVAEGLRDVFDQTLTEPVSATFSVGDAQPSIQLPSQNVVTLDPIIDDAAFTLSTINHDELTLLVYQVDPLVDWLEFQEKSWQLGTNSVTVEWPKLADTTIAPTNAPNEWVKTSIDLGDYTAKTGHVVLVVTPSTNAGLEEWQRQPLSVWVQQTDLGLDAYSTEFDRLMRVTSLSTGDPIAGATVTAIDDNGRSGDIKVTNSDGIALTNSRALARTLVVSHDDDQAIIGDFWSQLAAPRSQTRWYVIDDRGVYKPGETARVKGLVRTGRVTAPASLAIPADTIRYTARDAFGNEFATGTVDLSDQGGFDLAIELPADITLGEAGIEFTNGPVSGDQGAYHYHQLSVQEFRRPDFEVGVMATTAGPYVVNDPAAVLAEAAYFATGPLAGADVQWNVTARAGSYAPPGWSDFTFGIWQPWWLGGGRFSGGGFNDDFGGGPGFFGNPLATERLISTTDAGGEHALELTVTADGKPRPLSLSAAATVIDVNRQAISGATDLLMHPSSTYVGLRGERSFIELGDELEVEVITTSIDGERVTSDVPVTVDIIRNTWQFTNGSWQQVDDLVASCEIVAPLDEPGLCRYRPELGGSYRIAATVVDDQGRSNLTELTRWVAGDSRPAVQRVELEQVTIIPQGELFEPGETAELLIQSPFTDAHGLVILTAGTISSHEIVEFDENGSLILEIPVTEADIPAIGVHVEVVGTAPRGDTVRPAFASGQITLEVSSESRRLTVQATPAVDAITPGADTSIDVIVTDAVGDPVAGAELAVIVVDEAVLSLTGYELRDPLASFYQRSGGWLQAQRGRASLVLSDSGDTAAPQADSPEAFDDMAASDSAVPSAVMADSAEPQLAATGGDDSLGNKANFAAEGGAVARAQTVGESGQSPASPIDVRTRFDALAVFEPEVVTNANGRATIDVPVPDSLTRYRIMVVAAAGSQLAGTGESNLTARLPISVRPTAPRFANFGDSFEFPVVVQNATDEDRKVDVAMRATNLLLGERDAVTITVPANDRVEVRFAAQADQAGTARFQVVAASGDLADAADGSFPVYTPATSEAFATYGVLDSGSVGQTIAAPTNVFPQFGGLEISTSSTAVSSLTDAVLSLQDHPYQNADALASRIIAIISLDSILTAFESADVSAAELQAAVASDLERLVAMQNPDGGFNWWRRGGPSVPFVTVSATHALVLAQQDGSDVDQASLGSSLALLADIDRIFPSWYSEETKTAIRAYGLHVEHLAGVDVADRAAALFTNNVDDLSPDVAAWLWPAVAGDASISAEIERQLNNRVTETANAATFTTSYNEQDWLLLHSDRRTDAIVLNALLNQAPQSDLVPKTLNGILAARGQRGAWRNVQENSWILIAGGEYFEQFESDDPSFVTRAWLGDDYVLAHEHQGRRTEQGRTIVPMVDVINGGDQQLVIDKDGSGRLYYRIGVRYAPSDLTLEPRDQGFVVQRTYQAIDNDDDVSRNEDGSWSVAAGARVRVRVTMVADSRRTHVALIDPLPAGFEAVNPTFATSEPLPSDPGDSPELFRSWFRWFNHQNLRDDRAEAFSTWLGAGTYEYTYVARATIPGTFVVPPARAEQLYEPEVFGRSASTMVTITDE